MENYARDNAAKAGLGATSSLRVVHGVSEALPLASKSCDAVVCSLTLCSVVDPARSVAEIKRVLRPGGQFVFWEHVLSETDPGFAEEQVRATPGSSAPTAATSIAGRETSSARPGSGPATSSIWS